MNSSENTTQGADSETKGEAPPIQVAIIPVTDFQQNCSLIWDPSTMRGTVVDPGGDVDRILKVIKDEQVRVERILLTHGHIDHIGGASDLADALEVPVEGPHEADKPLIDEVVVQALQFGVKDVKKVSPNRWLIEGDVVEIAGRSFEVLHCPGHSPGHVVFFDRELRFAVSGDVLFAGSVGRTDLPGGNHEALIKSIKEKLLPLGDDVSFLPGHGQASTFGQERAANPFLV